MKKTIFMLFVAIPFLLLGQETKKITDKSSSETFYVLKSDHTTKHGLYSKLSYNKKLLIKGYYKQGIKDSIWDYYDLNGQLTHQYNHTNAALVFYQPDEKSKDKNYRLLNTNNTNDSTLSRPPIFLGGDDYILSELVKNISYPPVAYEFKKSGKVYVLFTVDKNGKASNFHVDKRLGSGLDEEAIRVLKNLPDHWIAGLVNGQPVDVEVTYPINFRIQ